MPPSCWSVYRGQYDHDKWCRGEKVNDVVEAQTDGGCQSHEDKTAGQQDGQAT